MWHQLNPIVQWLQSAHIHEDRFPSSSCSSWYENKDFDYTNSRCQVELIERSLISSRLLRALDTQDVLSLGLTWLCQKAEFHLIMPRATFSPACI